METSMRNIAWLPPASTPLLGIEPATQAMCPDQELNQELLVSWVDTRQAKSFKFFHLEEIWFLSLIYLFVYIFQCC